MTAPVVQIMWSRQLLFLAVMGLTFLALAMAIFAIPKRVQVRSSVEIGSVVIEKKPETIEPPEQVARQISSVYGPATLLVMAGKGTSPAILSALQNPSVESIGRSVVVVSTINPNAENEAKEFQGTIADLIIKDLSPRARALRESIAARISLATKAADDFEQQIKVGANEIERISALSEDLRGWLANQRADLGALYQRTGAAPQPGESTMIEARIRELHDQISSQTTLLVSLIQERSNLIREIAATRRLYDTQARAAAEAQFEQNSFTDTRVSLPASLMPAITTSRQLSLLLVALSISILVAFGTVVLLHKVIERTI